MISRRDFLKNASVGLTGLASLAHSGGDSSTTASRQNVLLVTMDTTGRKHMGCYGYSRDTTPNLDLLAEEALLFEDSYSSGCKTLPSLASLMTGLYPHNHGTVHMEGLSKNARTLGTILRDAGYETTAITSVDFLNENTMGAGFRQCLSPANGSRRAEATLQLAREYLDGRRTRREPFFLWIHLWDPHDPYLPPGEFRGKFFDHAQTDSKRLDELISQGIRMLDLYSPTQTLFSQEDRRLVISQYDGEIAYMDARIGVFLEYLEKAGRRDDSILIFTADHGESLFEQSPECTNHKHINEPVIRIPLIIRHPDFSPKRIQGLVQNIDIAPTVLTWLGLKAAEFDGKDMTPLITDGVQLRKEVYCSETGNSVYGMADGRWKVRKHVSRATVSLPPPETWIEDLALPRIEFTGGSLGYVEFEKLSGVIKFGWRCPPEAANAIEKFVVEAAVLGRVSTSLEVRKEGNEGHFSTKPTKRAWNSMASTGSVPYRVIGKDKDGKTIAASSPMTRQFDAPLGRLDIFDLSQDPVEKDNLADNNPELLSEIGAGLERFIADSVNVLDEQDEQVQLDPEDEEAMKAHGYL